MFRTYIALVYFNQRLFGCCTLQTLVEICFFNVFVIQLWWLGLLKRHYSHSVEYGLREQWMESSLTRI